MAHKLKCVVAPPRSTITANFIRALLKAWRQRPRPADLELLQPPNDSTPPSAECRLLYSLFASNNIAGNDLHSAWQAVYSRFLRQELKSPRIEFKPLFDLNRLRWPPTREDMFCFLEHVAQSILNDKTGEISIEEVLANVCGEYGSDVDDLDEAQLHNSQQAVFIAIAWLTMLFQVPLKMASGLLQMTLPNKVADQSITEARLSLVQLIGGFGPLLPTPSEVTAMVASPSPSFIHATSLSVESLVRIDRIRIVWTDALASHLSFDPFSRMLCLYRYPSVCALNCTQSGDKSVIET
ncbi:hypothetical protein IG631_21937 [Alternaria alternata]|nr:hypothetical protein IG631_21937 [Alternaria alternata]